MDTKQEQEQKRQKSSEISDVFTNDISDTAIEQEPAPQAERVKTPLIRPETIRRIARMRKSFLPIHKERLVDYLSAEE